jgi:hypothetical protein
VIGEPESGTEGGPLGKEATERDREVVLGADVDLQVRGPEGAVDGAEGSEEVAPERLAHPLAADHRHAVVGLPVHACAVDEPLEERRVAADEVGPPGPDHLHGVQDLVHVGAGALDDAVALQGDAHVDAGRPGAHREGVDRDPRPRPEAVAREVADERVADRALVQ